MFLFSVIAVLLAAYCLAAPAINDGLRTDNSNTGEPIICWKYTVKHDEFKNGRDTTTCVKQVASKKGDDYEVADPSCCANMPFLYWCWTLSDSDERGPNMIQQSI